MWEVSEKCLEDTLKGYRRGKKVSGRCLEGVLKVSVKRLEGIKLGQGQVKSTISHIGTGQVRKSQVSTGQVGIGQVGTGLFRTGQVWTGQHDRPSLVWSGWK